MFLLKAIKLRKLIIGATKLAYESTVMKLMMATMQWHSCMHCMTSSDKGGNGLIFGLTKNKSRFFNQRCFEGFGTVWSLFSGELNF